jgi:hypothetical protein
VKGGSSNKKDDDSLCNQSIPEEEEFIEERFPSEDKKKFMTSLLSSHKTNPSRILLQSSLSPHMGRTRNGNTHTLSTMSNSDLKNMVVKTIDFLPFSSDNKNSLSPSDKKKLKKFVSPT